MQDEKGATTQGLGPDTSGPWLVDDLDLRLLHGDRLWERLMGLLRAAVLRLLALPCWSRLGPAVFKQRRSEVVPLSTAGRPGRRSRVVRWAGSFGGVSSLASGLECACRRLLHSGS